MAMYGWVDLKGKIKRYFKFSPDEIKAIIISILVVGFIVSFNQWGRGTVFELGYGLFNLLNGILIAALVILVHNSAQRLMGLHIGFRVEYKLWGYGLIFALVMCFVTRGNIWLLIPGGIVCHHLAVHRLGYFRYGLNLLGMSFTAMAGSLADIALAVIFKGLLFFMPDNLLLHRAMLVCVWYAVVNMLPIPPLDGSKVFFNSRLIYAYVFGSILGAAIFLSLDINVIWAVIFSILTGIIVWFLYYTVFERKLA